jgi:hypothetical protein
MIKKISKTMIKKFNDFLNESKKINNHIDFKSNEDFYKKRLLSVIDDIFPVDDRNIKVYYESSLSGKEEINAKIIINPIINVNDNGYNVSISFDIYDNNKQLISFAMYDIKNNSRKPIWKNTNVYDYYLDITGINKIIRIINTLFTYTTNISNKSKDILINSVYTELYKKE